MNDVIKRGILRVRTSKAVIGLGQIYSTPVEALSQLPENSIDAFLHLARSAGDTVPSTVWIVLMPDRFRVIDNGTGMGSVMLRADREVLDRFYREMGQGPSAVSPEDLVAKDSPSRSTLEWVAENVAFSAKGGLRDFLGVKAIGALAYSYYAEGQTYLTRPVAELAKALGIEKQSGKLPAFKLSLPTVSQMNNDDITYTIEKIVDGNALKDPWGNVIEHGTVAEVTGIKDRDDFRPGLVVRYLRDKFGGIMRERNFRIIVVDRMTEEAKKEKGCEKVYYVEPTEIKGDLIYGGEVHLDSKISFNVAVYFNPVGKAGGVRVTWNGVPKFNVKDLSGMNHGPWDSEKIVGTVEFPYENGNLWDFPKEHLVSSPEKNHFTQALKRVEVEIQREIDLYEEKQKSRNASQITREIENALVESMQETEAFRDYLFPTTKPVGNVSSGKKGSSVVGEEKTLGITAKVLNQYDRGAPGIKIRLTRASSKPVEVATNAYGRAVFGEDFGPGRYRMTMVVPSGATSLESSVCDFVLEEGILKGYNVVFRLHIDGLEDPADRIPVKNKITKPRIMIVFMPNPDVCYGYNPDLQIIEINRVHPEMNEAMAENDLERQTVLIAQYASAAITQNCIKGDIAFVEQQHSRLFARLYVHAMERLHKTLKKGRRVKKKEEGENA